MDFIGKKEAFPLTVMLYDWIFRPEQRTDPNTLRAEDPKLCHSHGAGFLYIVHTGFMERMSARTGLRLIVPSSPRESA